MNTHLHVLTEEFVRELLAKVASEESQKAIKATQEATEDSGRFKMLITSGAVDRDNEVILPEGLDTTNYMKNPVVLLFHKLDMLPIGVTESLTKTELGWVAEGRFAPADANPLAQQVRKLYDLGIMRASSVGFMVKQRDRANPGIISKSELYEWSFVPVPSNPDALSLLEANGFDVKELVTKGFLSEAKEGQEVKFSEPVETKGQIEDTLAMSNEMRQEKYENMWAFWDEIYKFCDAYYSDMTKPEDFTKLVGELVANLSALKPAESMEGEEMKAFISKMEGIFSKKEPSVEEKKEEEKPEEAKSIDIEEKAGRTISKKTRAILQAAHDATSQACDTLGKLLEVADGAEGSDEESDEEKAIAPSVLAELETLRQREAETKALIRSIATACNVGLSKKK